ncbi:MAG: ATP-dependent Clp protease ATP-binding subunit, partial [Candidatus Jacksonbacteria bacterium]|nr:ATP-dependent Clp protease ATP-binding subunit [Candidatus Jacksonbacteria bacterium]
FTYQALVAAVELSNKLIHTEHQPEKAHGILQEVASGVAAARGKRATVTDQDVARAIAGKINMPVARLEKSEGEKLLRLEGEIHKRYINQDYAVKQVSAALRRARAELRDENRPIANFLFVGPTGVGKTELVKRIASVYFNSEKDMIRLDMSEFQEVGSITRLLGSADAPGLLTESARMNPYSVLLLDELEKAHPNILNLFLQVMDDGRLTSGDGEVVDFTNLIIVATSNAGTKKVQEYLSSGKKIEDIREQFVKKDLLEWFKPEFINRFDDVIIFQPLSEENIQEIARLILTDIAGKLEGKGIMLRVAPEALRELARIGFDPLFGARPLRRAIQDHVQNSLANYLIAGKIGRRDTVHLEPGGVIRIEKATEL